MEKSTLCVVLEQKRLYKLPQLSAFWKLSSLSELSVQWWPMSFSVIYISAFVLAAE